MAGAAPDGLREALARDALALDEELGRGGMSVVYRARDLRHDRLVAVKVLRPDVPGGAERFVSEIRVASPLVHPHIIPLYDSGAVDGTPYFVMPFIEGESLRSRLRREGRLPIPDAVQIAGEIAEALEFAHGRGILHRDIKPENVLLQAGHALVADFGVARALSQPEPGPAPGERLTGPGFVLGTAEYMSPEQASGEQDLDGRSDLYSLGCVLYEMLTGIPPFTGKSPREVMARRFGGPPTPVRELRPEVRPELAAVVDLALAGDPADRFPNAAAFLAALGAAGETTGSRGRPSRSWLLAGWLLPALALVAALAALGVHDRRRSALDPRRVVVARLSNETGDTGLSYVGRLAADRLTASLAGVRGLQVATSARVIPSRLTTGLQVDSLDDPARLRTLAEETAAGTVVSGSYFRENGRILVQAEITNANNGTLVAAVGPVGAPVRRVEAAVDSLSRGVDGALRRRLAARP